MSPTEAPTRPTTPRGGAAQPAAADRPVGATTERSQQRAPTRLSPRVATAVAHRPASRGRRRQAITVIISGFGAAIFLAGLLSADAGAIGEFGLVGLTPGTTFGGAALMLLAAVMGITAVRFDERLTAVTVAVPVTLISAAPAIVYDTARFSWAFKHVGIVDYIARTRGFDQEIDVLPIYHNWPGFFAGAASLTDWLGFENAIAVATWAPVALNLATMVGLVYLLGQFTDSRRTVWMAVVLFFVTNWIGQDYFSPQALAYILYLVVVATALRFYGREPVHRPTWAVHLLMSTMILAAAASHQLTPLVLIVALAGMVVAQRTARMAIPFGLAVASSVFWLATWARTFVESNLAEELSGVGSPVSNAALTLAKAPVRSDAQEIVALAGRGLVLAIGLLGFVGLLLRIRRRRFDLTPLALLGAPLVMAVLEFGGEILFRIVLFMLPMLCLLAAEALMSVPRPAVRFGAALGVVIAFFAAFTLPYYGKDGFYTFTDGELAIATQMMDEAPPNTLLVEGSRNYPSQFMEYEKFTYVSIERESQSTQARIAAAPGDVLHDWLSNPDYSVGYLILTRSQQRSAEALGSLPADFLGSVESELRSDPRFRIVLEDPDAVVFTVVPE